MTSILKVDTIKKTDNSTFPIGKVLQVVTSQNDTSNRETTSTSYVTAGTTATITPSSTSSKIFVDWLPLKFWSLVPNPPAAITDFKILTTKEYNVIVCNLITNENI